MEGRGDELIFGGVRQQVAGQLFDGELIESHSAVEGADDPVAVGPHGASGVIGVAGRVRIAGEVEPFAGPVFAVFRALQQVFDELLPRLVVDFTGGARGGESGQPCGGFCRSGRQTDQVEEDTSQEELWRGLYLRLQAVLLHGLQGKVVDGIADPG